jgi:hypothetical protein
MGSPMRFKKGTYLSEHLHLDEWMRVCRLVTLRKVATVRSPTPLRRGTPKANGPTPLVEGWRQIEIGNQHMAFANFAFCNFFTTGV